MKNINRSHHRSALWGKLREVGAFNSDGLKLRLIKQSLVGNGQVVRLPFPILKSSLNRRVTDIGGQG